ncbi:MAG: VanZ family protein [Paludibacteraceae bacterium]|nr:VanZ family protein [Paludibacteraceae bacterium]
MKRIEISNVPFALNIPHIDKFVHFLMYMILGIVLCYEKRAKSLVQWTFVVSFPIFFGTFIEFLQTLIPYRSGDLWDALINAIGTMTGIIIYTFFIIKHIKSNL